MLLSLQTMGVFFLLRKQKQKLLDDFVGACLNFV